MMKTRTEVFPSRLPMSQGPMCLSLLLCHGKQFSSPLLHSPPWHSLPPNLGGITSTWPCTTPWCMWWSASKMAPVVPTFWHPYPCVVPPIYVRATNRIQQTWWYDTSEIKLLKLYILLPSLPHPPFSLSLPSDWNISSIQICNLQITNQVRFLFAIFDIFSVLCSVLCF